MVIPASWQALDIPTWRDPVLVIGASDSGKSTLARYLYRRFCAKHTRVGFLDGDVGQSTFGLPATLTLALRRGADDIGFPPSGKARSWFVGSNTPRDGGAWLLVGLHHLWLYALRASTDALVIDTSGYVDAGGVALKWAKAALFRPCTVVALQRADELTALLTPLRRWPGVRLIELPVCEAVQSRSREQRRAYRAACYRDYFANASRIPLSRQSLAVFPDGDFTPGRLAALESAEGFVLALALVDQVSDTSIWLRTPWSGKGRVGALRMGALRVDETTFEDTPL